MTDTEKISYSYHKSLEIPAQVSSLALGEPGQLLAGSDDGTVRVYDLTTLRVLKAIRGLDAVSSVVWRSQTATTPGSIWVASGRRAISFPFEVDKLVLTSTDALKTLEIGADEDDVLNELSINAKGNQLAFCTDSGTVGVVDLSTTKITRMRKSHDNVCGTVRFIPDRPSELVSGGYDSTFLHFDFLQGSVLSRDDLSERAASPSSGVSMSPPFILSLSISSSGVIAAGTADGRVYVGTGGEKSSESSTGRQQRRRKWEGLRTDGRIISEVAEGPIVALAFTAQRELLTCTLLGKVVHHQIHGSTADSTLSLVPSWTRETKDIFKVNAMAVSGDSIIIGGFKKDGRGVIEIWTKTDIDTLNSNTESK
ncbi:hypothetical protein HYDPIDRAFT_80305 [Hydnomerulius pinastri MD-312]|nr:hypothetical protein HYDPIDRAFT_80305 [Hydnomerulius pinastri MD-312]